MYSFRWGFRLRFRLRSRTNLEEVEIWKEPGIEDSYFRFLAAAFGRVRVVPIFSSFITSSRGRAFPARFLVAFFDLFLQFGVMEIQKVLHLIDVHHSSNGNTIFFKNNILLFAMDPSCCLE